MANPLVETKAFLDSDLVNLPIGTDQGTKLPASSIDEPYIQYAWDGTPSDADNREDATVRITVWTPRGKTTDAQDIAAGLRARFLLWSSADTWCVERGSGRLAGTDGATKLPFCSFTVGLVLRAVAP